MKNKKIYPTVIALTFVVTFMIMGITNKSYSYSDNATGNIPNGTIYRLVSKNMYTHYHISNTGFRNSASGTKLINSPTYGEAVVYCAEAGKKLGNTNKKLTRYSLDKSGLSQDKQNQLNAMMQYAYPYITLTELKQVLKNQTDYNFDNLTAQEAIAAVQASIWAIVEGENEHYYKIDRYIDTNELKSFKSCENYYKNKIVTSEEEAWYKSSGCSKTGNFYKYVYQSTNSGEAINRINQLYYWYRAKVAYGSYNTASNYYKVKDKAHFNDDGTVEIEIDTNVTKYSGIFKDSSGNKLYEFTENPSNNKFKFEVSDTVDVIIAEFGTNHGKLNVSIYNSGNSTQDFIGADRTIEYKTIQITRDITPGKIIIYKVKDKKENVQIKYDLNGVDESICGGTKQECLNGAKFEIYYKDYTKPNNLQKVIVTKYYERISSSSEEKSDSNLESTIKSNEYGFQTATLTDLPPGKYYIKETRAPIGYDVYDYNTTNVDKNGYIEVEVKAGKTTSVIVNNNESKICFSKVETGTKDKILDGATIQIYDTFDEVLYADFNTSSTEGAKCLTNLQFGDYYLDEIVAPPNYVKPGTRYHFVYRSKADTSSSDTSLDKDVIELEVVNNHVYIENDPGVYVTKSDASTGKCLEGAKLTIKDKDGKVVDEWTSTCKKADGTGEDSHQITLKPGTYTLIETSAPNGYATAESIEFTINENGKVDKTLDMKDAPLEACIKKVSKDGQELSGATFEIYDKNNTLVDTIQGNTCLNLPIGEYTVKETKAPDGYQKANDTVIKVVDKGTSQVFEIINELEVPKTSLDASKVILMIASIFIIFGLGLVGYYVYQQKH